MTGTEIGVVDPVAAFYPCYGGPFLTLHPLVYAKLLKEKVEKHKFSCYTVALCIFISLIQNINLSVIMYLTGLPSPAYYDINYIYCFSSSRNFLHICN